MVEFGEPGGEEGENQIIQTHSNLSSQKEFFLDSVGRYSKKIDHLNNEYNQLLAETLEKQRQYFDLRLSELNQEEGLQIENKKKMILSLEDTIIKGGQILDQKGDYLEDIRSDFSTYKTQYAQVLQQLFDTEKENKILET
mmetsp:Transcript_23754/g.23443  ORF Transcript_23754/g.23443 Transcript_23754/m.23443 type:complete len:140 (-) Transcript_23754:288-707(-)